jgi:hypothetical protein
MAQSGDVLDCSREALRFRPLGSRVIFICRAFAVSITRCTTCIRLVWDIYAHLAPSTPTLTFVLWLQLLLRRLDVVNLDGEARGLLQPMIARVSRGHGALVTVQMRRHQIFSFCTSTRSLNADARGISPAGVSRCSNVKNWQRRMLLQSFLLGCRGL